MQKTKRKFLPLMAAVILCAMLLVLSGCGAAKEVEVNLNDYVQVDFSGYDTIGTAQASFDAERFSQDFEKQLVWTTDKNNTPEGTVSAAIADSVSVQLERVEGLSNGESVKLSVSCDVGSLPGSSNAVISCSDRELTVSGLTPTEAFDAFEGAEVSVSGTEGASEAVLTLRDDLDAMAALDGRIVCAEDVTTLHNGETLHYSLDPWTAEDVKDCIEQYGMYPAATEFEVTVSGLSAFSGYVKDIEDLPLQEMLDALLGAARDYNTPRFASNLSPYGVNLNSIDPVGYYFWAPKADADPAYKNTLYLVLKYSTNITKSGETNAYEYYGVAMVHDIHVDENGRLSFMGTQDLAGQDYSDYIEGFMYTNPETRYTLDNGVQWQYWGEETLEGIVNAMKSDQSGSYDYVTDME